MIRSSRHSLLIALLLSSLGAFAQLGPLNWTGPIKVEANNIFLLWHDHPAVGDHARQKLFDFDFRNDAIPIGERLTATPRQEDDRPGEAWFTDADNGMFTRGARESVVSIWGSAASGINIMIPDIDTSATGWTSAAQEGIAGNVQNARAYVRALDIDGDSLDEFIVSYLDTYDSVRFSLYDVDSLLQPTLLTTFCDVQPVMGDTTFPTIRYCIETADLDGDGDEELALMRINALYDTGAQFADISLKVFDFVGGLFVPAGVGQLDFPMGNLSDGEGYSLLEMGMVAGNFVPGGPRELALFCISDDGNQEHFHAQVPVVSTDLQTVTIDNDFNTVDGQLAGTQQGFSLDAGDLIGDDRDEVALTRGPWVHVYGMITDVAFAPVFDFDAQVGQFGENLDLRLHDYVKISDVNQDGSNDIIGIFDKLGTPSGFSGKVYSVSADSLPMQTLIGEFYADEQEPTVAYRPYSIATGNYDGLNFTIGEPTHNVVQGVVQPVVVLNAPPVHFDMFGTDTYDLNECYNNGECAFEAQYRKQTSTSVEVSSTVRSDWATSRGMSASWTLGVSVETSIKPLGLGGALTIEASMDYESHMLQTYGEHFSNTTTSSHTVTIGTEVTAKEDDRIYSTVTEYDVWEYPVYHGNETFPRSTILALVPLDVQATWFPSKSYNAVNFVPDHEVSNILSYPAYPALDQNPNMSQAIAADYVGDSYVLDASSDYEWFLGITDFLSNSADTAREEGSDVGLSIGAIRFDGDFTESQMSTHRTSVTTEIDLNVHLGSVDMGVGDVKYTVTPYAYWDKGGALVVDYAARPEIAPPGFPETWWQQQYGVLPDPTFVLPWRLDPEKGFVLSEPAKRRQTKDIFFSPEVPYPDDTLTITARVRNFSLLPTAQPVSVSFYLGDPDVDGVPIIGIDGTNVVSTAGPIEARGRADVELRWVIPPGVQTYPRIYAVLDEGGLIAEVHEGNNRGFNVLSWTGGPTELSEEELTASAFGLLCFPNPFTSTTTIRYNLPTDERTTITLFDRMGRTVAILFDAQRPAGNHDITFDGSGLADGVYHCSIRAGAYSDTKKLVLMR